MSERTMTVKELKDILDELWSVDEYHTEGQCEFNYDHPQVDRAVGYVDDLFITDKGQPDFDNIRELEKISDYEVYPTEQDSFGWLTAAIRKTTNTRLNLYFG